MDRVEAYFLLTERLKELAANSSTIGDSVLIEEIRGQTGVLYSLNIEKRGKELAGSIHANNSHQFELLEETVLIDSQSK